MEDAQLGQISADQLPESLQPLLADWNVLAFSESGWDDDSRRLMEAIIAATGLPVNPELEDWMALMAGAQQGLSKARGTEATGAVVRGELSKVVRYFQMAVEANPEHLDAALQLGYAWISAGRLDQAGTVFSR